MAKPNIWGVTRGDRWAGRREGVEDPLGVHDIQEMAVAAGRATARAEEVELIIQGLDPEIRAKDSHGHDSGNLPG